MHHADILCPSDCGLVLGEISTLLAR